MREAISSDEQMDEASLSSNILMIMHFGTLSNELNMAFLRNGASKWMARLMRRLTKLPFDINTGPTVVGFMKGCISYIEGQSRTYGYPCVVEALENRILESIVSASPFIHADLGVRLTVAGDRHLQDQCLALVRTIGCYTSYFPVLRPLRRCIWKAERLARDTQLPSELGRVFELLARITALRVDDKRSCPPLNACANPMVGFCVFKSLLPD
ncbi:hypothetical protein V5O48_006046 [Marasmius crinis-equi]|uniref:Uncharacterized protein n=1 Tax=Marasmius crinis-equi TaxID=585013 RepID=A0ABR3FKL2_9AGAR